MAVSLVATSTELCGTAPGFEDFGIEYRDNDGPRVRTLSGGAEAATGADEDVTDQRTDLFVTFPLVLPLLPEVLLHAAFLLDHEPLAIKVW